LTRELKTADEICAEVARLVDEGIRAAGGVNSTKIGTALLHPEPDRNGCNWYLSHFSNVGSHLDAVGNALSNVKARWNLK
jgi:hypothetical protein